MRTLVTVVIALLAVPVTASAGTVAVETEESCSACDLPEIVNVSYRAAPGEVNAVSFVTDGTKVAIRDDGAPVGTQSGLCRRDDEHAMTCPVTTATSYSVDLGDGDDRLVFGGAGADATLRGGAGNDDITSGRTNDGHFAMFGEDGDDRLVSGALGEELHGGAGSDVLEGGDGSDRLWGDAGSDRMDGGPGEFDSVEYGDRRTAVRVNLGSGTSGGAGERDTVANVEGAVTGDGDDVLIGDDAANELIAGRGRDRIDARGGDDQITTGRRARSIGCGAGRDSARTTGPETVIGPDCELAADVDLVPAPAQPALRAGAAIVSVRVVERRRTRGTVVLTAGPRGPILGTGDAGPGFRRSALARVRVPLTPAGRAYLRRPRGKLLTVAARLRDADGPLTNRWTIRLR